MFQVVIRNEEESLSIIRELKQIYNIKSTNKLFRKILILEKKRFNIN